MAEGAPVAFVANDNPSTPAAIPNEYLLPIAESVLRPVGKGDRNFAYPNRDAAVHQLEAPLTTTGHIMPDFSREEMEARIDASEARIEGRIIGLEGKIELLIERNGAASKAFQDTVERLVERVNETREESRTLVEKIGTESATTRRATVWTGVGTAITILLGMAAIMYSLQQLSASYQQNLLAAFQTGLTVKQSDK